MSEAPLEPSAVISPSGQVSTGRERIYDTYNTRDVPIGGGGGPPRFNYANGRVYNAFNRLPGGNGPVTVPKGVPRFLGSRSLILFSWAIAMALVSVDEWQTHHVLPRPARLWYTTLTYFLLAIASTVDVLVPIINLIALGLTIAVAYQFYTGAGASFGSTPTFNAAQAGAAEAKATGTAY